ncbi:hypothetical protein [Helicobacter mastomyrinus]|uniref:Uncharacterized protein n=1 Tax=Helicobacter mastomyrinus TaxID=287948 RepID=A0ABZ3F6Q0_9HELI|nr:hypothetical protein [uncultured Helicobacter sp.]
MPLCRSSPILAYTASLYTAEMLDSAKKWNLQLRLKEIFSDDPRVN